MTSVRRTEGATRHGKFFILGGCALVLMTLGADKPAPNNIALEIKGYLVPVRQVAVSPKVAGEVVEMSIEEGQKVKKGEVLARLDRAEFEAELRLAQARLRLAEAHVAKAGGRIPDLAIARANVEVAKAEVGIAELRLDGCTIRAPVGGTVLVKRVEVGTRVDPRGSSMVSTTVCELADSQAMDVELSVNEREVPLLEKGQNCLIRMPTYPRTSYKGRVVRFLPVADRAKGCVTVRVRVEVPEGDDRLRPESAVLVQVLRKE